MRVILRQTQFEVGLRPVLRALQALQFPAFWVAAAALVFTLCGCTTPEYMDPTGYGAAQRGPLQAAVVAQQSAPLILREGNVLEITFPSAPTLNGVQRIRTDGRITLPVVGEITAAGLTPAELEKVLADKYAGELIDKEVRVTVQSANYIVFVTGAVQTPGKIVSERPLTALEAIMEAGGFNYATANLKGVRVIRNNNGKMEHYRLDLGRVLRGESSSMFYLVPSDIVYVPERFSWF
jgi:polysaccharide biosynthesis/export protein